MLTVAASFVFAGAAVGAFAVITHSWIAHARGFRSIAMQLRRAGGTGSELRYTLTRIDVISAPAQVLRPDFTRRAGRLAAEVRALSAAA